MLANLSKMDVEIAMDYEKLRQIRRHYGEMSIQYDHFLNHAAQRIAAFYPITEEAIRKQLVESKRTPSYVPNLGRKVDLRLGNPEGETRSEEEYRAETEMYYEGAAFVVKPHLPYVSMKVERKFRGEIADSNPIRLVEENGIQYKISRSKVEKLKREQLSKLYTSDGYLIEALEKAFENKDVKTVKDHMEKEHLDVFRTTNGQPVRKVSIKGMPVSNYYKKSINETNYSILGMPKYYCVEVYTNSKGQTQIWGLRFVDMISYEGKLYLKDGVRPADYARHVMYLFPGEYIEIEKKGKIVYEGTYQNVYNINEGRLRVKVKNTNALKPISIGNKVGVFKYAISLNGCKSGVVKEGEAGYPCFAHCLSKKEND